MGGLLRSRMLFFSLLLQSLDRPLYLRKDVVDRRIVVDEPDLELRRIFHEFLHVPAGRTQQLHRHRNVPNANAYVFAWVRIEVHRDRTSRVDRDRTAKAAPIAPLEE